METAYRKNTPKRQVVPKAAEQGLLRHKIMWEVCAYANGEGSAAGLCRSSQMVL